MRLDAGLAAPLKMMMMMMIYEDGSSDGLVAKFLLSCIGFINEFLFLLDRDVYDDQ